MVSFNEIINYASNNEVVFRDLKFKIENKNIIPYVGSGLSVFAGFPTWGFFLDDLENNYGLKSPTGYDFLERADWISDKIGKNLFASYIVDTFNRRSKDFWLEMSAKAEQSAALFLLPWLFHSYVVTTNYDLLIEHVYGQVRHYASTNPVSYNNLTMQSVINKLRTVDRSPFIFHIHGSVFEPEEIILGQKSYDDAYKGGSSLVETLKLIFDSQSLLFLGSSISLNDRPIELLNRMCGSTAKHFAILPCKNGEQTRIYQEMVNKFNITPLLYQEGEHDSVRIILEVLLKEISPSDYDNLDSKLSSNMVIRNDIDFFRHDYSNPVDFVGREKELQELNAFLV